MRIFISYSRDDKQWVYDFARALREKVRREVWWDQELIISQKWWDEILNQIEACECFLLLLVPRYMGSVFCMEELKYAHARNKPILPLILKPCDPPPLLGPIQYSNIDGKPLHDVLLECAIALGQIDKDIWLGKYPEPADFPTRPSLPRQVADPVDPFELFNSAEDAAKKCDLIEAERRYHRLKEIDPEGFGLEADKRLNYHRQRCGSVAAYLNIVQQVEAGNLDSAQVAWGVFIKKYGTGYDPKGYTELFSDAGSPARMGLRPAPTQPTDPPPAIAAPPKPGKIEVADILPPPFVWCSIPEGSVTLDDASHNDGTQGGRYKIAAFDMAKYPITNAQYQMFVDAPDGYCEARWWDYSPEARQWRNDHPEARDTAFEGDDLPRTDVSWYEAVAFCRWLSAKTGQNITLPTEQQWQRAAQGDDNREYPWGEEFDPDRCNYTSSSPTPVTQYELKGKSPFGVMDMSGNVWEWCQTEWGTDSTRLDAKEARVVRGGSWTIDYSVLLRAADRVRFDPGSWAGDFGFRCIRSKFLF